MMDEETCRSCGARNAYAALHCWQCYATFRRASSPAPSRIRGLAPAGVYSSYAPGYAEPQVSGTFDFLPWGLIVRLALVVAMAGGGWWAYRALFSGFPFPNHVNGSGRVESELLEAGERTAQALVEMTGLDLEIEYAFYGPELQPAYVMFAAELDEEALELLARSDAPAGFEWSDLSDMPTQCGRHQAGPFCVWVQDETIVGVGRLGYAPELMSTAERLRAELD
jgi:hypothetical protein